MYLFFTQKERHIFEVFELELTKEGCRYFFKPIKSSEELKKISFSMMASQWHFFYSALVKFKLSLQALLQSATSLFHAPNHAFELATRAVMLSISALVNITIVLTLVGVNMIRYATMFSTTFFSAAHSLFAPEPPKKKEIHEMFDALLDLLQKVSLERSEWIKNINELKKQSSVINIMQKNVLRKSLVIYGKNNSEVETLAPTQSQNQRDTAIVAAYLRKKGLLDAFWGLMDTYPEIDNHKLNDIGYIKSMLATLEEHHAQAKALAYLYLDSATTECFSDLREVDQLERKLEPL